MSDFLAVSSNGIAIVPVRKTLQVWDIKGGRKLRTLEGHFSKVTGVAVADDGRFAVSASEDRTMRVWDVESGRELGTFTAYVDLTCCAISSDERTIVAGDVEGAIHYLRRP